MQPAPSIAQRLNFAQCTIGSSPSSTNSYHSHCHEPLFNRSSKTHRNRIHLYRESGGVRFCRFSGISGALSLQDERAIDQSGCTGNEKSHASISNAPRLEFQLGVQPERYEQGGTSLSLISAVK